MSERLILDAGEHLLWSGRPQPTAYALKKATLTFLFGIPFFAFAVFWTWTALSFSAGREPQYFWLFGVPFLLIGLGLLLSPLWQSAQARATTYTLTTRRAVIDTTGPLARRISVPLEQIPFIELQPGRGRPGHVLFREVAAPYRNAFPTTTKDGFIAVPDADKVERLLRDAVAKLRGHGTTASRAPS